MNIKNRFLNRSFLLILCLTLGFVLVACDKEPKEDTTVKELNTDLTDQLSLDQSYSGKVYQTDRIGEVELVSCTDGDTATFRSNGSNIPVRFLDVDTPETKGQVEPWGLAASEFTCDKLTNAETIVLEGRSQMIDTYGRYLAYIWYDGRLLNLELVEMAYTKADSTSDPKYGNIFMQAETKARTTGKRVYGEKDPNFDYGRSKVDLEHLRTNIESYLYKNVEIEGVVTRKLGEDVFVELDGFGIYLFTNYSYTSRLTVGNRVKVKGTVAEYEGSYQITGVTRATVEVISEGNTVEPTVVTINDLNSSKEGALLRLNDLEITRVSNSGSAKNIYVKDSNGNTALVRIDGDVISAFADVTFTVGDQIDVIAPLTSYRGDLQLMLCTPSDVIFN